MIGKLLLTLGALASDVIQLTANDFDAFIQKNPKALVKFYAPWCGHCKKLAPEYEKAASTLKGKVTLAEVDLDDAANAPLKKRFQIQGYPTIKYFEDGDAMAYDGGRDYAKIVKWATQITGLPVTFMGERAALNRWKEDNPGSHVLAYEGSMRPGNPEFGNFQAFCKDHRQLIPCVAYPGTDGEMPVLELFRPSETSSRKAFDFETTGDEIKAFVLGERLEYFAPISPENWQLYQESGLMMVWFVGTKDQMDAVKAPVEAVATQTRGFYTFVWMDVATQGRQAESMLATSEGPAFVIRNSDNKKGTYKGPAGDAISEDSIKAFIKAHRDNTLELSLKSEPVPESNDEPVTHLVGLNIAQHLEEAEEYMLMIHAPWCGHCKKFKPAFEEAATALKSAGSKTLMAMVDATANDFDLDGISFTGFPTIYFKAKDKKPVRYTASRDLEGVVNYIAKNGAGDFDAEKVLKVAKESNDEL